MIKAKIIRPSVSTWASPIVLVAKKDGSVRFCVDYRKDNSKSTFDAYPMPRVEELFEKIGPAKVISTLDLAEGSPGESVPGENGLLHPLRVVPI